MNLVSFLSVLCPCLVIIRSISVYRRTMPPLVTDDTVPLELTKQGLVPGHGNMEAVLTALTSLIYGGKKHTPFRSSDISRSATPRALWPISRMEVNRQSGQLRNHLIVCVFSDSVSFWGGGPLFRSPYFLWSVIWNVGIRKTKVCINHINYIRRRNLLSCNQSQGLHHP